MGFLQDEKYGIVHCRCDVHGFYFSYVGVFEYRCKKWKKERKKKHEYRERLLELIAKAKYICANDYSDHTENEYIADMLLDKGVTFVTGKNDGGRWVPVTEGLPKYTGIYFTTNTKAAGKIRVEDLWFEDGQFYEATYGGFKERKVTHWAKLPEPPEGD